MRSSRPQTLPFKGCVARRDPFNDGLVPLLRLLSTGLSILIAMAATGVTLVGFGAVALTWGAKKLACGARKCLSTRAVAFHRLSMPGLTSHLFWPGLACPITA